MRPQCYIIAGPNGAGKTTFALEFLPRFVRCLNFVNPDLIAQGLSPLDPGRSMARAGRLVLEEIRRHAARREDFAFETILAGRTYCRQIHGIEIVGYIIRIIYLWLPSPDLALSRIQARVEAGGHSVPEADVRRRFKRSLANLFGIYRPLVNSLNLFDNSGDSPVLIFPSLTTDSDRRNTMTSRDFSMEEFSQMALTAFRQAVARVMEDHRRRGKPVAIWKDGRVVWKIPDPPGEIQESPGPYETSPRGHDPGQNSAGRKD